MNHRLYSITTESTNLSVKTILISKSQKPSKLESDVTFCLFNSKCSPQCDCNSECRCEDKCSCDDKCDHCRCVDYCESYDPCPCEVTCSCDQQCRCNDNYCDSHCDPV